MPLNVPKKIINVVEHKCTICEADNSLEVHKDQIYGFTIDECQNCGNLFRKNFADSKTWDNFLKKYHRSVPSSQYWLKDKINSYMLNKLIEFEPSDRVLIIDSGLGFCAENIKVKSITKCQNSISHHLFDLSQNGGDCRNTIYIKDRNYNSIICLDYLHYIHNAPEYLEALTEKLTDDGILVVSVPIIDCPSHDIIMSGLADQYANFFTSETIVNMFIKAGLKVDSEYRQFKNPLFLLSKSDKKENIRIVKGSAKKLNDFKTVLDLMLQGKYEEVKAINKFVGDAYFKQKFDTPEKFDASVIQRECEVSQQVFGDYIPIIGQIAQFNYMNQNYMETIRIIEFILEFTVDHSILGILAQSYYDIGVYDEAIKYFKMALDFTPPDEESFKKLSSAIYQMREFNERI